MERETPPSDALSVVCELLAMAEREPRRRDFLSKATELFRRALGCNATEIRLRENGTASPTAIQTAPPPEPPLRSSSEPSSAPHSDRVPALSAAAITEDELCTHLLNGSVTAVGPRSTPAGSLWIGSLDEPIVLSHGPSSPERSCLLTRPGSYPSVCWMPFALDPGDRGLLILRSESPQWFTDERVCGYEPMARILGVALVHRTTRLALRERVKELACLYGMARLVARRDMSLRQLLQSAVEVFPPAFLYPDIASARIVLDGESFASHGFREGCHQLRADLVVDGGPRGHVEVTYRQQRPPLDEGAFLQEERHLIDMIARELALIIDQHQTEAMRERLQEQLRQADRLATLGQLSAGVAHELNEPLSCILGFAQLASKDPSLSGQTHEDLDKIVSASLHAREIVRKLMLLARQMPPQATWMSLNTLVDDGLYLLESHCHKSATELVKELDPELPEIHADPGQLHQVLINLSVNAIQAMPNGGRLTIRTQHSEQEVALVVRDTGTGMTDDVKRKLFMPFFTTKDVGEGTGLGLSIVDGIVSSHGGCIAVESAVGVGTTFTVSLPRGKAESLGAPSGDRYGW